MAIISSCRGVKYPTAFHPGKGNPQIPRLVEGDPVGKPLLSEEIRPIDFGGGQRTVRRNGITKNSPLHGFREVEDFSSASRVKPLAKQIPSAWMCGLPS